MKQIILFAVFLCVSHVVQCEDIEILSFRTPREILPEQCKKPGLGCTASTGSTEKCLDTVIMCNDLGNGKWQVEELDKCVFGKTSCINGVCSNKTNSDCKILPLVKFPCNAIGMFPDPFDCQAYHICCNKGVTSDGLRCDEGHMYDPLSTYCKIVLPTAGCPVTPPVPTCVTAGDKGAVAVNKSIYYICTLVQIETPAGDPEKYELYPKMFLCLNGKMFSGDKCI